MSVHPAALSEEGLLAQCDFHTTRRSGPGGQHRNKVETAVVLTHQPTGIRAEASERRSQAQNRSVALQRLRVELAIRIRYELKTDDTPSELWQNRTLGRKLQVSTDHQDFPALLAEALDRVTVHQFELSFAATALGVSKTQLVRFLQLAPVAWQAVNAERVARNLRPLREEELKRMSATDRDKWNEKYRDPHFAPRNPSPVLLSLADWLPATRGHALDMAGGCGRHSIWLAKQGFEVTLADVSAVGLKVAEDRAQQAGVKIQAIEHDLEQQGPPPGPWDLMISICYLWQPTPETISGLLQPGGVFIMIQPTTINLTRHEKPPRDFLLQPGELAVRFSPAACQQHSLQLCHLVEGWSVDDRHDAVLVVRRNSTT